MATATLNRCTELKLGNNHTLRNRVVVPPMASETADDGGFVTERTLAHYARLAEAKPGLLIAEYTFVHLSGKSEDNQLGVQSDAHVAGLTQLATLIKRSGAVAGLQITHAGGKTERALTGGALMGPSSVPVPVKDREMEAPSPMTAEEIAQWKTAFSQAVDRAAVAGFDLVEFHSAHGYGLNQWLSPITNHRTDTYGGDLQGRMRLLLEIIADAKARHPDLLLSVRMPGQDFLEDGLKIESSILVAQALEKSGVNLIHVSSGIGGWRRPRDRIGEGYLVSEAAQIQAAVSTPVIGVGGIESGTYIDESLQLGRFTLAAVGRAILKDPSVWNKANCIALT